MIIDLTPTHDQTGPARLLDLVEDARRARWRLLAAQPADFAHAVQVIAMDGFGGYADVGVMPTGDVSCLVGVVPGLD